MLNVIHDGGTRFRRYSMLLPAICAVWALGAGSNVMAQAPVRDACVQTDSGERIKCKFGNVIEQQRGAAEMIGQMGMLPGNQVDALMKQVERAGKAQGRTDAMSFKQLTKKSNVDCQVQEIIGDGKGDDDGICTGGEDCAEVIGDQIGNDDGICKPVNGAKRETCVQICDAPGINGNPDNFDDDPASNSAGQEIEESLDDLTDQYEDINTMLANQPLDVGVESATFAATGACATVHRARPNANTVAFIVGAAEGARVAADIAERFCDQSVFGANTSAVCAVIEGVAGAGKIVAVALQFEDGDITSNVIDSTYACLQETSEATAAAVDAVGDVSDDISAVDLRVAVVGQQVQTLDQRVVVLDQKVNELAQNLQAVQLTLVEVIRLLNTPQGKRPGFSASMAQVQP